MKVSDLIVEERHKKKTDSSCVVYGFLIDKRIPHKCKKIMSGISSQRNSILPIVNKDTNKGKSYRTTKNAHTDGTISSGSRKLKCSLNSWDRSEEHTSELQSRGHLV